MLSRDANSNNTSAWIALILFIFIGILHTPAARSEGKYKEVCYSLTITDERHEERLMIPTNSTVPVDFKSKIILYGRIRREAKNSLIFTAFNDSIRFTNFAPLPMTSFMSLDTVYYSTDEAGAANIVQSLVSEQYTSMVQCLFEDPAMELIVGNHAGEDTLRHLKEECKSGQYDRLNLPVTLGIFLSSISPMDDKVGSKWVAEKPLPAFNELGFHPLLPVSFRTVRSNKTESTIILKADTTVENTRKKMPNGEEVVILENKIHIGGTLMIDREFGIAQRGEIRITEEISMLRPEKSKLVGTKQCSYLLRFKTY